MGQARTRLHGPPLSVSKSSVFVSSLFFVDTLARKPTGNIGVQDVADVHQATVRALEKHAELLDADQVP